jgi:hypothetical protein
MYAETILEQLEADNPFTLTGSKNLVKDDYKEKFNQKLTLIKLKHNT